MAIATSPGLSAAGQDLHRRAIVVDGLLWGVVERPSGIVDGKDLVDRFVDAGITAAIQTLSALPTDDFMQSILSIYRYMNLVRVKPDKCLIVRATADILRAKEEGKIGFILGFQGTSTVGHDLRLLTILHALGIRAIGLAYNFRHAWGNGCYEPHDGGLTAMGQAGVRELNRLGILVDLSHVGIRTSLDAIEISSDPVAFTHSNVRKLTEHNRNLTDEQIKAIGQNGGVIGLSTHTVFTRVNGGGRPTLDDMLRHLEYIVDLIGLDHVGVGTDMVSTEGIQEKLFVAEFGSMVTNFHAGIGPDDRFVEGYSSFAEIGNLTDHLLKRGYKEEDILKVMGGNFMRVFRAVFDKNA